MLLTALCPLLLGCRTLPVFLVPAKGQQHLANITLMYELVSKLPLNKSMDWALYSSTIIPYPTVLDFNTFADLVQSIQKVSGNRYHSENKRMVFIRVVDGQHKQECPMP